ncbi:polysaccharide biosynthesis/export family protein [Xylophilus sp. GOD-11R]|uniref:polysaccharide biosynthesis/export family protein n=1 Tax=Xylophilus sp. GOD-11R TaxID=3089814 RepID=UPI00298BE6A4|nr:polysaccharide biosynthesis/export family protein [Xylophilus sp. GOD-11R]WPB55479.1 polysaccharide biosynthesis/export family protein [Xylophilus sp. GOD-11R]
MTHTPDSTPRRRRHRLWLAVAPLLALLQACAVPGFGAMDDSAPAIGTPSGPPASQPVTPIDPQLIRQQQLARPQNLPPEVQRLIGTAPTYTLGPGDVVGIIVYDHPELLPNAGAVIAQQTDPTGVNVVPGFIIGASGEISFPYIGRTRLQGLTEIEASDLITRRIATYIKDPQVTVRIQAFRSQRAYVEGEVRQPGIQIFTDAPMTLAEAIARAGGITAAGDRSHIALTRDRQTTVVSLPQLQAMGVDPGSIPLKSGDMVYVHNRDDRRVYVMGEILRPTALTFRQGRLSLNEALGDAGGPNLTTADTRQVYVIRNDPRAGREVYHLDAKNPAALALADGFELQPRDVVYVDSVALVSWNRVVSLILPAAQVVNLGNDAARR